MSIPTGTIETLPIFMAIADGIPHTIRIDNRFVDYGTLLLGALDSLFITLLPLIFLVTVLRQQCCSVFTSHAPCTHDTQSIRVAHTQSHHSRHNDSHFDPQ